MRYLVLNYARKIKKIVIPNLLQIFFIISIVILTILVSTLQLKPAMQTFSFKQYIPMFVNGFLLLSHILIIILFKKNKEDLFFQQYVRKSYILAFIFRWRREINILLGVTILLYAIFALIFLILNQYLFLLWMLLLFCYLFINSLLFLILVNMKSSQKKVFLLLIYYIAVFAFLAKTNSWIAFGFSLAFIFLSLITYKELDYIRSLHKTKKVKQRQSQKIKDYPEFIFVYMMREKVYLELGAFSIAIALLPVILNIFGQSNFLINNIGLVNQFWTFLIIEMCSLLGIGFSELIKLHTYFFLKNAFNKYLFTLWYLLISFIISSFFIILAGTSLSHFIGIPIVEFPFTFIEVTGILLLSMYVSLFFPSARKKVPLLPVLTIIILWVLTKNFILQKANMMPNIIYMIYTIIIGLLYIAIALEISSMKKGNIITNEN